MAAMATTLLPIAAQARPGWHGGRGWHRDRGIDGGDLLAGILIIGGIAAIASAASNSQRNRDANRNSDYRYRGDPRDYPQQNPRYDPRGDDWTRDGQDQGSSGQGDPARGTGLTRDLDDAVNACADEASRKGDVAEIRDATRSDRGYRVTGRFGNGDSFSCDVRGEGGVLLDIRRGGL